MRARVDSGEFSRAVKVARRYTTSSATDVTRMVHLAIVDNDLELRATTYMSNCIARVNAFDTEAGTVVTACDRLAIMSTDTGELFDLFMEKGKLVLDYAANRIEVETTDHTLDDFPVWVQTNPIATVDRDILNIAVLHTRTMAEAGMPIKASVHFIPKDDEEMHVMAHDGFHGVLSVADGKIHAPVSVEAESLARALSVMDGIVNVGIKDSHITISGETSPYRISFTTIASPDPTEIMGMFHMPTMDTKLYVQHDGLMHIAAWCKRAIGVDKASQILLGGGGGTLGYTIRGRGVNIEGEIAGKGSILESIFHAELFSNLSEIRECDEGYVITSAMGEDDRGHFWYINGEDKYCLLCMKSNLFD
jgi:hypothetical protein